MKACKIKPFKLKKNDRRGLGLIKHVDIALEGAYFVHRAVHIFSAIESRTECSLCMSVSLSTLRLFSVRAPSKTYRPRPSYVCTITVKETQ